MTTESLTIHGAARFSDCGRFRYSLLRCWRNESSPQLINFVMLNPSTATAETNDPTIERCQRRAVKLGYDGLMVTNLFALRSTDPTALYKTADAIGAENNAEIIGAAKMAATVVCAWGSHGALRSRGWEVKRLLREAAAGGELWCLGTTKDGHPRHPLYVAYQEHLKPF